MSHQTASDFEMFCEKQISHFDSDLIYKKSRHEQQVNFNREHADEIMDDLSAYGSWMSNEEPTPEHWYPSEQEDLIAIYQCEALAKKWRGVLQDVTNHSLQLDLSAMELSSFPKEIFALSYLTSLNISDNKLLALPKEIGNLVNLAKLDLSNNQLDSLPAEIGRLQNLKSLNLSGNQITSLPPEIGQLVSLEILIVSHRLAHLPAQIGKLHHLTHLDISGNRLISLPSEIGKLKQLTILNASDNQIVGFPAEIGGLEKLSSLDLANNKIAKLPDEIGKLSQLSFMSLSSNPISSLPNQLCKLSCLEELLLSGTEIHHLPDGFSQLAELQKLNLAFSLLSDLPKDILKLKNLKMLDLRNSRLKIPVEILEAVDNPEIIFKYLESVWGDNLRPLAETKLLVVGQGSVGKTSLVKRLTNGEFDPGENKTEGIAIAHWQVPGEGPNPQSEMPSGYAVENPKSEIRVNIWDFGGQEIMHATHQFFLTHRSLYLLVIDSRQTPEENRVEYWLKIIQSFGGESPVIIIGNKSDQHTLDIDRAGLQKKYPNIAAILETSAATGAGIDELKRAIAKQVNNLPHVHDLIPETWFNIKTRLEELAQQKNYIQVETYLETCAAFNVSDESSQRTLVGFLHDLGVVLHFQDDPRLAALGILNPQWVSNGVYKILNAASIFHNKGVLRLDMLDEILDQPDYPRHLRLFIVDMMKRFELCFDLEPDRRFLVPDLLPKEQPSLPGWQEDAPLSFQYYYPVLPSSVMTRFIVRLNRAIDSGLVWRGGVLLKIDDNLALVKADSDERRLSILVNGPEHTRRDTLAIIRHQLDEIHASIKGLNPKRKIPVPGQPGIEPLDYEYLLELERDNIPVLPVFNGQRNIKIDVKQLLNGIESEEIRRITYINISGSVGRNVIVGDNNAVMGCG